MCKQGCNCRGKAFSTDSGLTWTDMELDPELTDPVCEGSINTIGQYTAFSNPPMSFARANMSIALSLTGGYSSMRYVRLCMICRGAQLGLQGAGSGRVSVH